MQDFLQHFRNTHVKVSPGFVETLIKTQREELFTGVMCLYYATGEFSLLTFLNGSQQKLYRNHEKGMEVVPQQAWADALDRPDASVAFIKLSEEALRFMRVTCEALVLHVERAIYSKEELLDHVSKWAVDGSPTILHLLAEKIDKFYLIDGNSAPIIEELSWVDDEAHFSICDASFPDFLLLHEYQMIRYASDGVQGIWQEYELRFAFNLLMRLMLNRFSDLAGRTLTERLCEQLTQYATDGRKNIRITINGVANHCYFNSLEDEVHVFREILHQFRVGAGSAIGVRLADDLAHDTLLKVDSHRRELLKRHIYD